MKTITPFPVLTLHYLTHLTCWWCRKCDQLNGGIQSAYIEREIKGHQCTAMRESASKLLSSLVDHLVIHESRYPDG